MPLRTKILLIFFSCTICMFIILMNGCRNETEKKVSEDTFAEHDKLIGSGECKSCHQNEYNDWLKSDHYLAIQVATDSTVLGNFNHTEYRADGVTNKFFMQNGKYFINTQGDDGNNHDYEVKYTFGYFPLQQYLVAFPGGKMQPARVSWNSSEKKWFHQYAGQKIYHHDWLHWTGSGQNWNTMCASCHSTNLQKNYDYVTDSYKTTWSEINVSCESCHGGSGRHVAFIKSEKYKDGEQLVNSGFVYSNDTFSQLQVNTCVRCHSRKSDISATQVNSKELLDNFIPQAINSEFYFADGQINEEDYEFASFTQSKMFHNNVRCSNCHNVHSGKLKISGNNLCLSCHNRKYDNESHHFHAMNTEGSQCVNCHMQQKTYMGIDHRRDHSFRLPRPDQSVRYGTPNACNSCHKEKTAKWAMDVVIKNYGPKRPYHFSDDLIPGSRLDEGSEMQLVKLSADTSQPEIARAAAAGYLGNIISQNSANALLLLLNDPKPMVRYNALRSLENFEAAVWQTEAVKCLTDKVRAVRIAAADLYHRIPGYHSEDYSKANEENVKFLNYQTDFPVGNVMLADYEMQSGDYINAIVHYLRGLAKDSLMNYARLNLSAAYNSAGKNQEALKTLNDAAEVDPQNERIFYNLGLLHSEMGNNELAINNFSKSQRLGSKDPHLYYNHGILLQQMGRMNEGEKVLLKGIALSPEASNLNYALAYLYMNKHEEEKARKYVETLKRNDPDNPDYQEYFRRFK
jgi:predicted CXXCH cytochrome family protein